MQAQDISNANDERFLFLLPCIRNLLLIYFSEFRKSYDPEQSEFFLEG